MVLLTLFAGDGGYNPQLQRVGEGETFLHGYLTIHVIIKPTHNTKVRDTFHPLALQVEAARDIPNMESWISGLYDKKVFVNINSILTPFKSEERGNLLLQTFPQDVTDPFVDVRLGNARIAKTSVIDNDLNPVWNEKFRIEVGASSLNLRLQQLPS